MANFTQCWIGLSLEQRWQRWQAGGVHPLHLCLTHASPRCLPTSAGPLAGGRWQAGAEGDQGLRAQLAELSDRFQQLTQVTAIHGTFCQHAQLTPRVFCLILLPSFLLLSHTRGLPHLLQSAKETASSLLLSGSVLLGAAPAGPPRGGAPASVAGAAVDVAEGLRRASLEAPTSCGVFELVEGSAACAAGPARWPRVQPPPLTLAELATFFDEEGEP